MKLGDICKIKYGKDHKKLNDGSIPVYGSGGVMRHVDAVLWNKPSVLIPRKGTLGNLFYVDEPFWAVDTLFWTDIDAAQVVPKYLFYQLKTKDLASLDVGTAVPSLTTEVLNEVQIDLPSLEKQKQIVEVLGCIDAKIDVNAKLNGYLLELAMARFESELETESKAVRFGDVVALEDSKRVPLNSRDREARKGPYPYYGATSVMDHVDDYLFDGVRVLLGEDGTVVDSEGKPILQYVWGKYWVNNHAHILAPSGEYSLEAIYIALSRTTINHIVTGAVQMKISQRNLKSLELEMPSPESLDYLQDLFAVYRSNQDESAKLSSLRDALLPKLMSGEIDVSKVDLTQLNSHLA